MQAENEVFSALLPLTNLALNSNSVIASRSLTLDLSRSQPKTDEVAY